MNIPKNVEIILPLSICEECRDCYPEVVHAYSLEEFGNPYSITHYEIVCKFAAGCVYAYEKGVEKHG